MRNSVWDVAQINSAIGEEAGRESAEGAIASACGSAGRAAGW